jgi:hypothetical protein
MGAGVHPIPRNQFPGDGRSARLGASFEHEDPPARLRQVRGRHQLVQADPMTIAS